MTCRDPSQAYRRLLAAGSASFFTVGTAIVLPGALLPVLVATSEWSWVDAGTFLASQPVGHLVAVSVLAGFAPRIPAATCAVLGFVPLVLGLLLLSAVSGLAAACLGMCLSGVGIGCIESGANTELLRDPTRANRALNLSHLFFGLACVTVPPFATAAVQSDCGLVPPFLGAAVLTALSGFLWLHYPRLRQPPPPQDRPPTFESASGLALLGLAMALYVGAEIGIGSWFTQYSTTVLQMSLPSAGIGLSLYWGGLTVGRLYLGLRSSAASAGLVVGLATAATLISATFLLVEHPVAYAAAAALLGAALSGIFPGILALSGRQGGAASGRAVSLLLAAAGLGQIVFPWLMGLLASRAGLTAAMWAYPTLCLALLVTLTVYWRMGASNQFAPAA